MLNNLALVYLAQGRFNETESLLKRALSIREKSLGPEHPDVAETLGNQAELYRHQGRFAEAEAVNKRVVLIVEKALGSEHPRVGLALNNWAIGYELRPLKEAGLSLSAASYPRSLSPTADTGRSLVPGETVRGLERYDEAELIAERVVSIYEKAVGPAHPRFALSLNLLGSVYVLQERFAEAEPLFKRALSIREQALGAGHADVGESYANLAELYLRQGRAGEAEPFYQRALAISTKALGPDHIYSGAMIAGLGRVAVAENNWIRAVDQFRRSANVFKRQTALGLVNEQGGLIKGELRPAFPFSGLIKSGHRLATQDPARRLALETFRRAIGRRLGGRRCSPDGGTAPRPPSLPHSCANDGTSRLRGM